LPPHAASASFFIVFGLKLSLAALAVKQPNRPFPRARRHPAIAVSTGACKNSLPHHRRPKKNDEAGACAPPPRCVFKITPPAQKQQAKRSCVGALDKIDRVKLLSN